MIHRAAVCISITLPTLSSSAVKGNVIQHLLKLVKDGVVAVADQQYSLAGSHKL